MNGNEHVASLIAKSILRKPLPALVLIVVSILSALSSVLPSYALRFLLDEGLSGDQSLPLASTLYFLSFVLYALFNFAQSYLLVFLGERISKDLRLSLMRKLSSMPATYYVHNGAGYMTSRVMDDVYSIMTLFTDGIFGMAVDVVSIVSISISLFVFSWPLGLLVTSLVPLVFLLIRVLRKRMFKSQKENRKFINRESDFVSENLTNARTVKNLAKEGYVGGKYAALLKGSYKAMQRSYFYDSIFSPIVQLVKSLVIAAIVLLAVKDTAGIFLSIGTLAAAIDLVTNIFTPLEDLGTELEGMQEGNAAVKRCDELFSSPSDIRKDEDLDLTSLLSKPVYIEAKGLGFAYPDGDQPVFGNADFVIHAGDNVIVTGRTGAGKTTLFKLLLGLYKPSKGSLRLAGIPMYSIPDRYKRNLFGYVAQGFSPIGGTIADQVSLCDKGIEISAIRKAMAEVGLDSYVMDQIPGGYAAPFKASQFSRGQLQLLSAARALVMDPPLVLLDEISANLDSVTEKTIVKTMGQALKGRTVVTISHRYFDPSKSRILFVGDGTIREIGSGEYDSYFAKGD